MFTGHASRMMRHVSKKNVLNLKRLKNNLKWFLSELTNRFINLTRNANHVLCHINVTRGRHFDPFRDFVKISNVTKSSCQGKSDPLAMKYRFEMKWSCRKNNHLIDESENLVWMRCFSHDGINTKACFWSTLTPIVFRNYFTQVDQKRILHSVNHALSAITCINFGSGSKIIPS